MTRTHKGPLFNTETACRQHVEKLKLLLITKLLSEEYSSRREQPKYDLFVNSSQVFTCLHFLSVRSDTATVNRPQLQRGGHLKMFVGPALGAAPKATCTVLGGVHFYDRVNLKMAITQHHVSLISMQRCSYWDFEWERRAAVVGLI